MFPAGKVEGLNLAVTDELGQTEARGDDDRHRVLEVVGPNLLSTPKANRRSLWGPGHQLDQQRPGPMTSPVTARSEVSVFPSGSLCQPIRRLPPA